MADDIKVEILEKRICKLSFPKINMEGLKQVNLRGKYEIDKLPQIDVKNEKIGTKTVYLSPFDLNYSSSQSLTTTYENGTFGEIFVSNLSLSRTIPYDTVITPFITRKLTNDKKVGVPTKILANKLNAESSVSFQYGWAVNSTEKYEMGIDVEFTLKLNGEDTKERVTIIIYSATSSEATYGGCSNTSCGDCGNSCSTYAPDCGDCSNTNCGQSCGDCSNCGNCGDCSNVDCGKSCGESCGDCSDCGNCGESCGDCSDCGNCGNCGETAVTCSKNSNYDIAHSAVGTIIYSASCPGGYPVTSADIVKAQAKESCGNASGGCSSDTYTGDCISSVKRNYCDSNSASGSDYDGGDWTGCGTNTTGCGKTSDCGEGCGDCSNCGNCGNCTSLSCGQCGECYKPSDQTCGQSCQCNTLGGVDNCCNSNNNCQIYYP